MFGRGISKEGDILDLATDANVVDKSGSWYAYNGSRIGQGRENAKQYLAQNPLICEEIENKVRELHGLESQHVAVAQAKSESAPEARDQEGTDVKLAEELSQTKEAVQSDKADTTDKTGKANKAER